MHLHSDHGNRSGDERKTWRLCDALESRKDLICRSSTTKLCQLCRNHSSRFRRWCQGCQRKVGYSCKPEACWDFDYDMCRMCAGNIPGNVLRNVSDYMSAKTFCNSTMKKCQLCRNHSSKFRRRCPGCQQKVGYNCKPEACWDHRNAMCTRCADR